MGQIVRDIRYTDIIWCLCNDCDEYVKFAKIYLHIQDFIIHTQGTITMNIGLMMHMNGVCYLM